MAPLSDAMTALELIRKQGYEKIGVVGFSAGGHLGAQLATLFDSNPSCTSHFTARFLLPRLSGYQHEGVST
jgi:dienelactone hydrolase